MKIKIKCENESKKGKISNGTLCKVRIAEGKKEVKNERAR